MKIVYILIALVIVIFILMIIRLNIARIRKRKVKYIPYGKRKATTDMTVKKIIAILSAAILTLTFCGCSKRQSEFAQ